MYLVDAGEAERVKDRHEEKNREEGGKADAEDGDQILRAVGVDLGRDTYHGVGWHVRDSGRDQDRRQAHLTVTEQVLPRRPL